jgi:hypothetical protein
MRYPMVWMGRQIDLVARIGFPLLVCMIILFHSEINEEESLSKTQNLRVNPFAVTCNSIWANSRASLFLRILQHGWTRNEERKDAEKM